MTRKDYIVFAATLQRLHRAQSTLWASQALVDVMRELADLLAADNPHFDRQRFLAACGVSI